MFEYVVVGLGCVIFFWRKTGAQFKCKLAHCGSVIPPPPPYASERVRVHASIFYLLRTICSIYVYTIVYAGTLLVLCDAVVVMVVVYV